MPALKLGSTAREEEAERLLYIGLRTRVCVNPVLSSSYLATHRDVSDVKHSKHIRLIVPLFLLIWFFGCLFETGNLGSMDAAYRLQVAHSLWTSDPQVDSADFDQSFPIGRDGLPQAPWGFGQTLVSFRVFDRNSHGAS